ncbi:MAG: FtsX-like permease family protein [Longimicrobiales bacterium]|nr:FtsX-like permease family protein [Longimicrobiales bacterium]
MVDRKLAERVFGDEDPLGKELLVDHFSEATFSLERLPVQIVGVVENVMSTSLAAEGRETIYVPYFFQAFLPLRFTVRTAADPASLVTRIRTEVAALDPDVPISGVATLESYVSGAMAPTRFLLALIGVFAVVALVLASLGLYGVISCSVRQRTREIGVRMAFGATESAVVRLVLGQGMALALSGIVLGLGASFVRTRVAESLVVGVSATDPVTFAGVSTLLLGIAVVAAWVPARKATLVDPVEALRDE